MRYRKNYDILSCPSCKNEEISVLRYSQRHGKTYGWLLNCPICGKFLIVKVEKIKDNEK